MAKDWTCNYCKTVHRFNCPEEVKMLREQKSK